MHNRILLSSLVSIVLTGAANAQDNCAEYPLAVATDPASHNFSADDVSALQALADEFQSTALMVLHDGEIVLSHGEIERPILLHSARKSIMSGLIGLLVDAGALRMDMTLAELGINDLPGLTETELSATLQDLMTARSGVYIPSAAEAPHMVESRPERGSHEPGSFYYYNNWDFNATGHIFERLSGRHYGAAFERAFADPLCMQDFDVFETYRMYAPGTMFPAYHIRMSARDLALFGQLYLQDGEWNGETILSSDWIAESTGFHTTTGWPGAWMGGYGYMWWRVENEEIGAGAGLPADMYTAAGAGGQYLTVIPGLDLVIVNRMNTDIQGGPRMGGQAYTRILQAAVSAAAPD